MRPDLSDLKNSNKLLRHLYRTRTTRKRFLDRIPPIFKWGEHRKSVERKIISEWPGGYVLINEQDYFYVPTGTDIMSSNYLIRPTEAEPVINNFCLAGDVAIDVGANFGEWSLQMARAVGKSGKVYAFEPSPNVANALRKTLEVNGQSHAMVIEAAVGNHVGDTPFTLNTTHSGKSAITVFDTADTLQEIIVPMLSLDDFVHQQNVTSLALLKIDVEGHEADVLEGALAVLQEFKPAIVLETNIEPDQDREKLRDILENQAYNLAGVILHRGIIETSWDDYVNKSNIFSSGFVNILLTANDSKI